ncbi:RNA polymerase factor sigma-54 [Pontiellaceae bacterium B1224]|nr:RNA polymerase factor sigma-54 [Pontiellaceae bacterium B1224]
MNTNIKMYHSSNQSQQLNLAPQLLNWLKILQVSSVELSELVDHELVSNPALETVQPEDSVAAEDFASEALPSPADEIYLSGSEVGERLGVLADIDDEWRQADEPQLSSSHVLQEKHDFMMDHIATASGLQDELEQAILFSDLSELHAKAARVIAGSIDGRGYLDASLEDIAEETGLNVLETRMVLEKFQAMAPAGIGARDLRECLVLQLMAQDSDTELAQMLVGNWLDHLAAGRAVMVAEHLGVDSEDVEAAFQLIRTLDPEPGRSYESVQVEYVEADLEIRNKNGELHVELLDERLPKLQLSSYCKRLLDARQGSKADLDYIRGKVREASFLIQGISQRQDTMLKVAHQIMRVQGEFLSSETGALQPLTMNKVAAMIGVHETTVSRAIANKYIRTERGLFEMRSFFKVGYRCSDGSSVTPERVKTQLEAFILSEDALKPLTDAHISERFKKQGLKVARRTVAKYREELGISSSKERLIRARRRAELAIAV